MTQAERQKTWLAHLCDPACAHIIVVADNIHGKGHGHRYSSDTVHQDR